MGFPTTRLRRLRRTAALRRLTRETALSVDHLMMPLFTVEGRGIRSPIPSLEGHHHLSVDALLGEVEDIRALNIPALLLFGIPDEKDARGSGAYAKDGIVQRAVRAIKEEFQDILVVTDVCLCAYTTHGHCGVVAGGGREEFHVENDETLALLSQVALSHAEAGADMVAPSDMMDGRVGAIRKVLDANGFSHLPILSYSSKYASCFYGPFREAAHSAPSFGDRSSYQLDPANVEEALREMRLDLEEGADILMVKPALPYLDVIVRAKQAFRVPLAAYCVSGEYAMLKAGAKTGFLDEEGIVMEALTAVRRAGADILITYFAKDAARLLHKRKNEDRNRLKLSHKK